MKTKTTINNILKLPLHIASQRGHAGVVHSLLKHGKIDPNKANKDGWHSSDSVDFSGGFFGDTWQAFKGWWRSDSDVINTGSRNSASTDQLLVL